MRYILMLAVFVVMSVSYCYGECFQAPSSPNYCIYEFDLKNTKRRVLIKAGETRRLKRKCLDCTCHLGGMISCCSTHGHFSDIPDACMVKKRGCRERLVMKNNPRKPCVGQGPISMVGR